MCHLVVMEYALYQNMSWGKVCNLFSGYQSGLVLWLSVLLKSEHSRACTLTNKNVWSDATESVKLPLSFRKRWLCSCVPSPVFSWAVICFNDRWSLAAKKKFSTGKWKMSDCMLKIPNENSLRGCLEKCCESILWKISQVLTVLCVWYIVLKLPRLIKMSVIF